MKALTNPIALRRTYDCITMHPLQVELAHLIRWANKTCGKKNLS